MELAQVVPARTDRRTSEVCGDGWPHKLQPKISHISRPDYTISSLACIRPTFADRARRHWLLRQGAGNQPIKDFIAECTTVIDLASNLSPNAQRCGVLPFGTPCLTSEPSMQTRCITLKSSADASSCRCAAQHNGKQRSPLCNTAQSFNWLGTII